MATNVVTALVIAADAAHNGQQGGSLATEDAIALGQRLGLLEAARLVAGGDKALLEQIPAR